MRIVQEMQIKCIHAYTHTHLSGIKGLLVKLELSHDHEGVAEAAYVCIIMERVY